VDVLGLDVVREPSAVRSLGGSTSGSLLGTLAWIGGLLAIFIPLCVWRCRRMS